MQVFLALGVSSFLLSLLLTPLARNVFRRLGVFDQPDQGRKIHRSPIPRIGGIPLALSLAISFALLRFGHGPQMRVMWNALPAALLIFAVGLFDELTGLKPWPH